MGSVVIVVVEPVVVGRRPGPIRGVELCVGPFRGQGAIESFDFAVGLRPVGAGPFVPDVGAESFSENP